MAHNKLARKLDGITYKDLGIAFDEGLVWEKLEKRISKTPVKREWNWIIAASLFLGVLLLPLSIIEKEAILYNEQFISEIIANTSESALVQKDESSIKIDNEIRANLVESIDLKPVKRKGLEIAIARLEIPELKKMDYAQFEIKSAKPQFELNDLSVIQESLNLKNASFNNRRLEKSRKLTISAQWQGSSNDDVKNNDDQTLKLKLDARGKSLN